MELHLPNSPGVHRVAFGHSQRRQQPVMCWDLKSAVLLTTAARPKILAIASLLVKHLQQIGSLAV
jgi:hypothetical protein